MQQRYVSKELTHFVGAYIRQKGEELTFKIDSNLKNEFFNQHKITFLQLINTVFQENSYGLPENVYKESDSTDNWILECNSNTYIVELGDRWLKIYKKLIESEIPNKQYELLIKVIREGKLKSKCSDDSPIHSELEGHSTAHLFKRFSSGEMLISQMVCFCDIPVADLEIHMNKYSRFGLSFRKRFLIEKGANPVFYIMNKSKVKRNNIRDNTLIGWIDSMRAEYFDELIPMCIEYLWNPQRGSAESMLIDQFLHRMFFSFCKPLDEFESDTDKRNYYMEREWRLWGDFEFDISDIYRIIVPHEYIRKIREDLPDYYGQITEAE